MTERKFKVGLLTTQNSPLICSHITELDRQGFSDLVLIYDSKPLPEQDVLRFHLRMGKEFSSLDNYELTNAITNAVGAKVYVVKSHNSEEIKQIVKKEKLDCLVNSGTPRKISLSVCQFSKLGIINIHPGALPKYRGSSAVEWSILNGDPVGNTAHIMNQEYDSGPILSHRITAIKRFTPYEEIRFRIFLDGIRLLADTLLSLKSGKVAPVAQNDNSLFPIRKPVSNELVNRIKIICSSGNYESL